MKTHEFVPLTSYRNDNQNLFFLTIPQEEYIFFFLEDLQKSFSSYGTRFTLQQPLFDDGVDFRHHASLSLDGQQLGELSQSISSCSKPSFLVYYPKGKPEPITIMTYKEYEGYELSDHLFTVNTFASILLEEQKKLTFESK